MADNVDIYKYEEISNKVLKQDRRLVDDISSEKHVDTNPHSIKGHISSADFGSRVSNTNRSEKQTVEAIKEVENFVKGKKSARQLKNKNVNPKKSLLDDNFERLNYTPTTESNKHVYSQILTWCANQLDNDLPEDVIKSLADIIIEILMSDETNTNIRKKEVQDTIGNSLNDSDFLILLDLVKRISDFKIIENEDNIDGTGVILSDDENDDDDNDSDESDDDENEDAVNERYYNDGIINDKDIVGQTIDERSDIVELSNLKSTDSNISIKLIDKTWLGNQIRLGNKDMDIHREAELVALITNGLQKVMDGETDIRKLELLLSDIPEIDNSEVLSLLAKNYKLIYFGIKLSNTKDSSDKQFILDEMLASGLDSLVYDYKGKRQREDTSENDQNKKQKTSEVGAKIIESHHPKYVDINSLIFTQGSKLLTNTKFQLPDGSFKRKRRSWEEIHVPPPKAAVMGEDEKLVPISELPKWAQAAFPSTETTHLNRIQSKVYPAAFKNDGNILMCAPTGAGKTNVAMLTVLRAISKFRKSDGNLKLNDFKIVYIAPLKALVQEQVREFERRLAQFGITVNELTGDSSLTKYQISNTQILVTTPEKWDVITRKNNDASYIQLVNLVIIDEIHLLHDERGPVIESIVARTLKYADDNNDHHVRFVGLSATLPNYKDVARFLNVDFKTSLFYFDATFRPCPLAQQFIGITEKKAFKKYEAMNEVCYDKVVENITAGYQVIIFVHSRKETEKTAKWISEKMLENDQVKELMDFSDGVKGVLKSEAESAKSKGLKEVLQMGIGIHHAGMSRNDRQTSEDLFAEGHIKVLVSTATLAWGVNLPAHTVIIKGTKVYSPEKGTWVDLSPQDILQMLGRAGRPRYDTNGEGIIITEQEEIKYYLAILNQQLPIESQMYSKLADTINAEIVAGSINTLEDCINWMSYTYLYVRMLHSRSTYHISAEYEGDTDLKLRRRDLAYSALVLLAKYGLIKYNYKENIIISTDLGKIASYYYISYQSIKNYEIQLQPHFTEIELFRMFTTSEEFKYVPIRNEEKIELQRLMEKAPIPINESVDDPMSKINVLLQAYISRLKLDGFALMADMVYIVQSAGRLFRAMYDLSIRKKWAKLARELLNISKMIEKRLWLTNSPLRQYSNVPKEIIQVTERSMTPWKYYLALDDPKLAIQALKANRFGNLGWEILQKFPRLNVSYSAQPITPSLLRVELEIVPHWMWDMSLHGFSETFTLIIDDCDADKILHTETFVVRREYVNESHIIQFTVPIFEIKQPNYFVSLISEKWLHCETRIPIILSSIKLPDKFPAPKLITNDSLISVSELNIPEFENVFPFNDFNKFQSEAFDTVYNTQKNIIFFTSKGNGKNAIAELALLNHWKNEKGRAVYLSPIQECIDFLFKKWKKKLSKLAGGKVISKLTGDLNVDLKLIASSHLVLATPAQFDLVSKKWRQRKNIQNIELVLADDIHLLGDGKFGCIYENVVSRLRFININLEKEIRFVALGSSIASYKDFADWLGVTKHSIFAFDSRERIFPVEVKFKKFEILHNPSLLKCLARPTYEAINNMKDIEEKAIVFTPSRKSSIDLSLSLIQMLNNDDTNWVNVEKDDWNSYLEKVKDKSLAEIMKYGIGFYYKNMDSSDRNLVEKLFEAGAFTCLIASKETCHWCPSGDFVIIYNTQEYHGSDHRYIDYTISDLLEMIGLSRVVDGMARALVLTNCNNLDYYKRFLTISLPLESHMNFFLHDVFLSEISGKLIQNRQDAVDFLTYSLFYRRIQLNPSFYGLTDANDEGISEYLSEIVENTLKDLSDSKIVELNIDDDIEVDEEDADEEEMANKVEIIADDGCVIASHHGVSFVTMQIFLKSLKMNSKLKTVLEVVSMADEFLEIPMRGGESISLSKIYDKLPLRATNLNNFESPNMKVFILLQAHFSRINLNSDFKSDLALILPMALNLLNACVDILSMEGTLNAMTAIDLCQMVVQGMWNNENAFKQIPYFDERIIERCASMKIASVYDIMEVEDDVRDKLFDGLEHNKVMAIADFVNRYPNLNVDYEFNGDMTAGESTQLVLQIERDEDLEDPTVPAMRLPIKKYEGWWVILGDAKSKKLFAIKKVDLAKESQQIKLNFTIVEKGKHHLSVWCLSDSYIDADKQVDMGEILVK